MENAEAEWAPNLIVDTFINDIFSFLSFFFGGGGGGLALKFLTVQKGQNKFKNFS
jgi:hypothetical protein